MDMVRLPDPLEWSATALAAAIRARSISAAEYVGLMRAHGERHAGLGAFIGQDFDALSAAARQADQALARDPARCGPLHGVPVALKDNIDTDTLPTTGGTPALRGHRAARNAPVWQRLMDAGALLAGKANMHELASGGSTDNLAFGRARNPFDRERTAGGSSGGSAVAVSARLAPVALGTDTGGSIRVPAALCGIFGLRPTHGRYSGAGIIPLAPSFDTAGPMARCIADLAVIDGAVTGQDAPLRAVSLKGVRLGVDRKRFFDNVHPDLLAVVDRAMDRLHVAGAALVEVEADPQRGLAAAASAKVYDGEGRAPLEAYLAAATPLRTADELIAQIASPTLRERLAARAVKPPPDPAAYRRALDSELPALRAAHAALMDEHRLDALIAPATPRGPLPFAGDDNVMLDGQSVSSWLYFTATSYAPPRGLPSLAVPAGRSADGLAVGLFLDGRHGGDRDLLALGAAVENLLDPMPRPPGL